VSRKGAFRGFIGGVALALTTLALSTLHRRLDNGPLQGIVNFFVSVPMLLSSALSAPLQRALFFAYWGLVGLMFGSLSTRKDTRLRVVTVLLAAGFIAAHCAAQVTLEKEFGAMLEGAAQGIWWALEQGSR
jgi:FtsH-binding integral membrane protein